MSGDGERVNHPAHYGGADNPYEAIKVIEAWGLGFCLGNAVKYIARAGKKTASVVEDLSKAAWYLAREIQNAGGGTALTPGMPREKVTWQQLYDAIAPHLTSKAVAEKITRKVLNTLSSAALSSGVVTERQEEVLRAAERWRKSQESPQPNPRWTAELVQALDNLMLPDRFPARSVTVVERRVLLAAASWWLWVRDHGSTRDFPEHELFSAVSALAPHPPEHVGPLGTFWERIVGRTVTKADSRPLDMTGLGAHRAFIEFDDGSQMDFRVDHRDVVSLYGGPGEWNYRFQPEAPKEDK